MVFFYLTKILRVMTNLDEECSICLHPLEKNVEILFCGHEFHTNCITKWVPSTCPLCRKTFSREEHMLTDYVLDFYSLIVITVPHCIETSSSWVIIILIINSIILVARNQYFRFIKATPKSIQINKTIIIGYFLLQILFTVWIQIKT